MNLREEAKQKKKEQIQSFAENFICEHRRSPSTQEIADALGINKSTVWRYLVEMDADQVLRYDGQSIVSDKIIKATMEQVLVPVSGVIPCGTPEEQEEIIERYYPLPRDLLGPGEFFMLRASGDSMVDAGIESGDLLIMKRTTEAYPGDIVAAIADNESTLKRLQKDQNNRMYLHPENAEKGYPDIWPNQFSIQGVAIKILKDI